MRQTRYPGVGKPSAVTQMLDELVMLLQASIEIANTERWALERGEQPAPPALANVLRKSAYEVTVVDRFHRVARRYFDQGGYRAVWERPFATGGKGRPLSVDVSLFDTANQTESRIELGIYSKSKLRGDAEKLHKLALTTVANYPTIVNLLALWEVKSTKLTAAEATKSMNRFKVDAAFTSNPPAYTLRPLLASSVDLFVAEPGKHRHVVVGLFHLQ